MHSSRRTAPNHTGQTCSVANFHSLQSSFHTNCHFQDCNLIAASVEAEQSGTATVFILLRLKEGRSLQGVQVSPGFTASKQYLGLQHLHFSLKIFSAVCHPAA